MEKNSLKTTVDTYTDYAGDETTVKTGNAIRLECLLVDIDESGKLPLTAFRRAFGIC